MENYYALTGKMAARGMQFKAERGIYPSAAPLGYLNRNGRIVLDPERAPLIREAFELRATGMPVRQVLKVVTRKGLRTRRGKKLGLKTLWYILQNHFYSGVFRWNGVAYVSTHPALSGSAHVK